MALIAGALGAEAYARLAAPYYKSVAAVFVQTRPWTLTIIDVARDENRPGVFLRLHGEVREAASAVKPAAILTTRVQVGAVIEAPLIFWTILLAWPSSTTRLRLTLFACGIPVFLSVETATTVCQLLNGFAEASAVLAGNPDPLTMWERWSRFIESGGRDVLAVCAALLTVAGARRLVPTAAARSAP